MDDAYDMLIAGLLVKQNRTTDYERKYFDGMLSDFGRRGYKKEEKGLKWRLQRHRKSIESPFM